jgi:DNA-binding transcriptional ArsR family regulator
MDQTYFIKDLDQVKAIADPLRMRLLEAFSDGPATTKQVAKSIGENATKLYHHVDALEKAGLVKLVETRPNRGTTEKYYQPVARRFRIQRGLLALSGMDGALGTNIADIVTYALEETVQDIRDSADAGMINGDTPDHPISFTRFQIRGTKEEIATVIKRLDEVLDSVRPIRSRRGKKYGMTMAFYPMPKETAKRGDKSGK